MEGAAKDAILNSAGTILTTGNFNPNSKADTSGGFFTGTTKVKDSVIFLSNLSNSADVSSIIQNALDSSPGVRVVLPRGTFYITGVSLPEGTILEGQGDGVTTLVRIANSNAVTTIIGVRTNCVVRGISINGNKTNQTVFAWGTLGYLANNVVYEDVTIYDNFGISFGASGCSYFNYIRCSALRSGNIRAGFWSSPPTPGGYTYHKYIDCDAIDNELDGIHIGGSGTTIRGGRYNHNGLGLLTPDEVGTIGAAGLYGGTDLLTDLIIDGVEFYSNIAYGLEIFMSSSTVVNCRAYDNGFSGIYVRDASSRVSVTNNKCWKNGIHPTTAVPNIWGKVGIQFTNGFSNQFMGNNCWDDRDPSTQTQRWGIWFDQRGTADKYTVIGNNCSYNKIDNDNLNSGYTDVRQQLTNFVYMGNN